jgi:hypothetical protein
MSNTGEMVKMLHDLVDYFTLSGVQVAQAPAVNQLYLRFNFRL